LVTIHVQIDRALRDDLEALAMLLGISMSDLVERALRAEIEAVKRAPVEVRNGFEAIRKARAMIAKQEQAKAVTAA
jgi:hypothetical protein